MPSHERFADLCKFVDETDQLQTQNGLHHSKDRTAAHAANVRIELFPRLWVYPVKRLEIRLDDQIAVAHVRYSADHPLKRQVSHTAALAAKDARKTELIDPRLMGEGDALTRAIRNTPDLLTSIWCDAAPPQPAPGADPRSSAAQAMATMFCRQVRYQANPPR
jgi:hypothetical protein